MPRQRRLHPDYEVNEDRTPRVPDPADIDGGSSLEALFNKPVPSARPRGRRGAPNHAAKAWFMEKGFFLFREILSHGHKELIPFYQDETGASASEVPSPRTVARWWVEWTRSSPTGGRRGAPSNPARSWYMTVGFPKQAVRGWTDRQTEVEYHASAFAPPHPSARSLRRWKREWLAAQTTI
jgi:hypothetical protein